MVTYITIAISVISVSFAIFFGLKGTKRADNQDVADRATKDTILNVKLDAIGENVKEIKVDMSDMKKQYFDMDKRLVKVEESTKSAHHRLDDYIGTKERTPLRPSIVRTSRASRTQWTQSSNLPVTTLQRKKPGSLAAEMPTG